MRGIFGKTRSTQDEGTGAFLARLRRDTRGNMLAIMAAALIPFCGLVGGGIDLSRMYITKTRLQHACDAGALAGRKAMGGGTWGTDDDTAAHQYFEANFTSTGMYGSSAPTVAFTENAGKVTGNASATLPMTLMRVLGKTTETLPVTCDADMRLPNTDVMFVLDTTGSMNCPADSLTCTNNGGVPATNSKIGGLKVAVKCFYEIVARLDTDATCTTGTPSGGTGSQVQIRFGFMPYATNVNVGKLLPTSYFANEWPYQTRTAQTSTTTDTGTPSVTGTTYVNKDPRGYATVSDRYFVSSSTCSATAIPADSAFTGTGTEGNPVEASSTGTNPRTVTYATYQYGYYYEYRRTYDSGLTRCRIERRQIYADARRTYSRSDTTTTQFGGWLYAQRPVNVGLLKNGTAWNSSFQWPIASGGSNATITWDGCIEERTTAKQSSYSPIPSTAKDLDIDLVPTQGDTNSLWGPALPDLIYTRNSIIPNPLTIGALNLWSRAETTVNLDYVQNAQYSCPAEARKLQSWTDPVTFDGYVDSLVATGNTYHDIGMLWGARFMSPTGIFASENALTPMGGEIQRNMIFMTDGDTSSQNYDYNAYGVPWFDRRQTDDSTVPTASQLNAQVNARFEALCTAVKNKNITLWVISFGNGSNTTTETRLSNCATPGRYFAARDSAALQSTFASIANQISQLRLTK